MREIAGWQCPPKLSSPGNYLARWEELRQAVQLGSGEVAVQAGGHIGVWPRGLAALYARVYTCEPDADNFACLTRNASAPGIFAMRAALGDKHGGVALLESHKSSGQHRVRGAGAVPVLRIDDLGLDRCDAILLDVEGYEIPALKGAGDTLRRCRPRLVIAEENKRCQDHGYARGDLATFLRLYGYQLDATVREDLVFRLQ